MTPPKPFRFRSSGASQFQRLRLGDLGGRQPAFGRPVSDEAHQLRVPLISPGNTLPEVLRESGVATISAQEVAQQGDAQLLQRSVVEVVAAAMAGSCALAASRAAGVGNDPTGASRNPVSSAHQMM